MIALFGMLFEKALPKESPAERHTSGGAAYRNSSRLSVACLFRLISHVPSWCLVEHALQAVPLWASFEIEFREWDDFPAAAARNLALLPDEHWPPERLAAHSEQNAAAPSVQVTDGLLFLVAAEDAIPPWVPASRVVPPVAEVAAGFREPDELPVSAARVLDSIRDERWRLVLQIASRSEQDSVLSAAEVALGLRERDAPLAATVQASALLLGERQPQEPQVAYSGAPQAVLLVWVEPPERASGSPDLDGLEPRLGAVGMPPEHDKRSEADDSPRPESDGPYSLAQTERD